MAGTHLWIANSRDLQGGGSVTEINADDGSPVRTLSTDGGSFGPWLDGSWVRNVLRGSYAFGNPSAIAVSDGRVWVGNDSSVTVIKAG